MKADVFTLFLQRRTKQNLHDQSPGLSQTNICDSSKFVILATNFGATFNVLSKTVCRATLITLLSHFVELRCALSLLAVAALCASRVIARADTYKFAITSGTDTLSFNVSFVADEPAANGYGRLPAQNLTFTLDGSTSISDIAFYRPEVNLKDSKLRLGLRSSICSQSKLYRCSLAAPKSQCFR